MGADVTGLQWQESHKPLPDPQAGKQAETGCRHQGTDLVDQALTDLDQQAPGNTRKDAVAGGGVR